MQSVITCAITLILLIAQSSPRNQILGKWQTIEEPDGLGSILEFRQDGFFSTTFRLISNGTFKIEGDRILRSGLKPSQSQELEVIEFKIEGARLILKTSEGEIALNRISNLMGSWNRWPGSYAGAN